MLLTVPPFPCGARSHMGQTLWSYYAKGGLPGDGRHAWQHHLGRLVTGPCHFQVLVAVTFLLLFEGQAEQAGERKVLSLSGPLLFPAQTQTTVTGWDCVGERKVEGRILKPTGIWQETE